MRRSLGRLIAIAFAVAAAVVVIGHFGEFQQFIALAHQAEPFWLLAALTLQFGTYLFVALGWASVLRAARASQPVRALFPVAISKLFADQAIPTAGVGGHVLLVERLTAMGTPRGTAVGALLVSLLGYYASYSVLAVTMLLVLWFHRHATPLLTGLVTTFLLVALAVPALALWLRRRGSQPLPPVVEAIDPVRKLVAIIGEVPAGLIRDRKLLAKVTLTNGLVFLLDAATLAACLLAIGRPFEPATAFLAFMAGSISATLAPIPLGLGSFEAACTAMMASLDIPLAAALTATLLFRGLTLWLPLLPSMILMRKGTHARKGER